MKSKFNYLSRLKYLRCSTSHIHDLMVERESAGMRPTFNNREKQHDIRNNIFLFLKIRVS